VQRIRQQGVDRQKERELLFKVREDILNRLVDEKLTDQEIKRNDIQVDDAQIDATIERIKAANYFTDEDLRRSLEQEGLTMESYRSQVKEQILRSQLVNYEVKSKIVVTEEDIKAYYDRHPEIYGGKLRYHLRNILLRVPQFAGTDEKQAVRERIENVRKRIESGESFADLARSLSEGPAAINGGDIGEFETDALSPQIQTALDGLTPGQSTTILDTDLGF
jgi:peptidyl-prolyl cis-trans isomerase SurA